MQEKRIATSPLFEAAPRNDIFFVALSIYVTGKKHENHCHCEPVRTLAWQSVTPINDNLLSYTQPPGEDPRAVKFYLFSSSGTKSRVMDFSCVRSCWYFTPAESSIRLEARVAMESAYLSER